MAFKTSVIATAVAVIAYSSSSSGVAAADCVGAYGTCGGSGQPVQCCVSGFYCQPWNPNYYQCMPTPSQCPNQQTDVDFFGNDLKNIVSIQPSACCDSCATTAGCKAYTWVNVNGGTCYLKTAAGAPSSKPGAISAVVGGGAPTTAPTTAPTAAPTSGPTTAPTTAPTSAPTPPGTCSPVWQQCGGQGWTGPTCCEKGSTCEKKDQWYSQCIPSTAPTTAPTPVPPTTAPTTGPTTAPTSPPTAAPTPGTCSPVWQQCGGQNWTGPTCCESGNTCVKKDQWYSQCLPNSASRHFRAV